MGFETVSKATIRENTFNTIATLLNNNKLSGWTVLSAFPEQNPAFPCLVVNPAAITLQALDVGKSKYRWRVSVLVDVFSLTKQGKEKNDEGMDNVMDTIRSNISTLQTYNLTLDRTTPFVDAGAQEIEVNEQGLNLNSITINLVARL
jgi:hypothetical protein